MARRSMYTTKQETAIVEMRATTQRTIDEIAAMVDLHRSTVYRIIQKNATRIRYLKTKQQFEELENHATVDNQENSNKNKVNHNLYSSL